MIDLFLKAIDRLIELARLQDKRSKARFEELFKPTFQELQLVHSDNLLMIHEFELAFQKIPKNSNSSNEHARATLELLQRRRLELLPLRQKLRALEDFLAQDADSLSETELKFLSSVVNYFKWTRPQHFRTYSLPVDLLMRLELSIEGKAGFNRMDFKKINEVFERLWSESVKEYNRLRKEVAGKVS